MCLECDRMRGVLPLHPSSDLVIKPSPAVEEGPSVRLKASDPFLMELVEEGGRKGCTEGEEDAFQTELMEIGFRHVPMGVHHGLCTVSVPVDGTSIVVTLKLGILHGRKKKREKENGYSLVILYHSFFSFHATMRSDDDDLTEVSIDEGSTQRPIPPSPIELRFRKWTVRSSPCVLMFYLWLVVITILLLLRFYGWISIPFLTSWILAWSVPDHSLWLLLLEFLLLLPCLLLPVYVLILLVRLQRYFTRRLMDIDDTERSVTD